MSFDEPHEPDELLSNMPRRCSHCRSWIAITMIVGMCAELKIRREHTFGCTEWQPTKNRKRNHYNPEGAR